MHIKAFMIMIYVVVLSRKVTAAEGIYIDKNGIPIKTTSTSTISTTTTTKKAFDNEFPMPIQVTNTVMNLNNKSTNHFLCFGIYKYHLIDKTNVIS
jgi:hypothetical protein